MPLVGSWSMAGSFVGAVTCVDVSNGSFICYLWIQNSMGRWRWWWGTINLIFISINKIWRGVKGEGELLFWKLCE